MAHSESYISVSNYDHDYDHDYSTVTNCAISKEANKHPETQAPDPQNGDINICIAQALLTEMLNAEHVYLLDIL